MTGMFLTAYIHVLKETRKFRLQQTQKPEEPEFRPKMTEVAVVTWPYSSSFCPSL